MSNIKFKDVKNTIKKSLSEDILVHKGMLYLNTIIEDYHKIESNIKFKPTSKWLTALKEKHSYIDEDGLKKSDLKEINLDMIEKRNALPILQDFKKRNASKWGKINVDSPLIIASGVANCRGCICVFLSREQLKNYNYEIGLVSDEINTQLEYDNINKYYNNEILDSNADVKQMKKLKIEFKTGVTVGMQNQLRYLYENGYEKVLKSQKKTQQEIDDIFLRLYSDPALLLITFESFKILKEHSLSRLDASEKEKKTVYLEMNRKNKLAVKNSKDAEIKSNNSTRRIQKYTLIYDRIDELNNKERNVRKNVKIAIKEFTGVHTELDKVIKKHKKQEELITIIENIRRNYYKYKKAHPDSK